MGRVTIRRATAADVPRVAPLFDAYRVFYEQPSDVTMASAFIGERIARDESVVYLAEAGDGTVLGFVQLYPVWSSTRTPPGRLWLLNDLFVVESARRGGVARELMLRAEQLARETGAVGLTLSTAMDNVRAQPLYESLGYVRDTRFYTYKRYF